MSRLPGPPAYVPTLTEIVPPAPSSETENESAAAATAAPTDLQELMVQRVLRQVDSALEKRLHEATKQLIREHVQALLPQLHDEIERVVREAVGQALDREMPASLDQSGRLESRHS